MRLRPIAPGSAAFAAFEGVLADVGLPTDDLLVEPARYYALGADEDDAAAFAGLLLLGDDAVLRSVSVPSSGQGAGQGRAVVSAIAELAAANGVRRLWLLTTTAEGFFARLGWHAVARELAPAAVAASRQFTTTCPTTAVLMCRKLG